MVQVGSNHFLLVGRGCLASLVWTCFNFSIKHDLKGTHLRPGHFDSPSGARDLNDSAHIETLKTLVPFLWVKGRFDLKARVILALGCMFVAKSISVYVPFIFKDAVDVLDGSAAPSNAMIMAAVPTGLIIGYGIARVVSLFFGEMRDAIFVRVGQHAMREIALSTFRHLHGLSLDYHLSRKTGGLSRIIERGIKGIDFLLRFLLFNILPTLFEIILISVIFWLQFGWISALITLACLSSYIAFTFGVTEWRLKFRREMNEQDTEANTSAIDSFLNFETVKYFTNEKHEAERYDRSLAAYQDAAVRSQLSLTVVNVGQNIIIALGLVVVLWIAARGVIDGRLTLGEFVLANSLLVQIYIPLNFLGTVYRSIKQSLTDMETMFGILKVSPDVKDNKGAKPINVSGGAIRFDNVSFNYRQDRQILQGISFDVPAGATCAIVGSSGAGKSTISRLLFRFYDATEGTVYIDGQDVRQVTQASLRGSIGVVPQDTVLFNDTIHYNIAYGRPEASEADIINAAKMAKIYDFIISLPDGFKTEVGERGLKLSGGEKQRVAIARTILKNPPILLLDEATSALDSRTEQDIQAALNEISKDRTTVIIAHRLSTVIHADEILVMEAGAIVERGTHADLLAQAGIYKAMWDRQQERE